jgi:hypothetical protein
MNSSSATQMTRALRALIASLATTMTQTLCKQCSSTTDSDSAPDCPDDRDTVQNCSSDKDSGSDIDVNVQICADIQHAARGDSQQRSDASENEERSRFLSAERKRRLCNTDHEHLYDFFFECAAGRFSFTA